jgi:hypothetical protein
MAEPNRKSRSFNEDKHIEEVVMQKETRGVHYKPHMKNFSQSLSPTYGINTEDV